MYFPNLKLPLTKMRSVDLPRLGLFCKDTRIGLGPFKATDKIITFENNKGSAQTAGLEEGWASDRLLSILLLICHGSQWNISPYSVGGY